MIEIVAADKKTWKLAAASLEACLVNYREIVVEDRIELEHPSVIVEHVVIWIMNFGLGAASACNAQKIKEMKQQFFLSLSKDELLAILDVAEIIGLTSLLDYGAQYVSDLLYNMTDDQMKKYLGVESDPLTPEAAANVQVLLGYVTPD